MQHVEAEEIIMPTLFENIIRSGNVTALEDHLKLEPKENVSQKFENGQRAIHVAIESNNEAMTTLLLFRYGANPYCNSPHLNRTI
jgi:ankyrin repeat protein